MNDICSKSTFTGTHVYAVGDDGVRCAFCSQMAPLAVADRMVTVKRQVDEYERIQRMRKAPGMDRQLAAIARKSRKKAS